MESDGQLRNLRDFLLVYNKMTEICFNKCISNLNYRSVTVQEEHCVASCAGKLIRTNHRLMGTYVQLMPSIVQKRISEYESMTPQGALPDPQPAPAVSPGLPASDIAANASKGKPTLPADEVKLDPAHCDSTTSVDSRTHPS